MRSFAHNLVEGQMPHYHSFEGVDFSTHSPFFSSLVVEANCMQLNTVERENLDLLTATP